MTPTPMLDAAIREGCDAVVMALDGATRQPIRCRWPACGQFCPSSQTALAFARAAFPWTPPDDVIEAMARAIWKVRSTRDWFEASTPEEMHYWRGVALAAYRAIPIVRELWPEEERFPVRTRPETSDDLRNEANFLMEAAERVSGSMTEAVEVVRYAHKQIRAYQYALDEIVSMIEGCADAPKNPDSLLQMVLVVARNVKVD